ncbi:uncharacterized protein LOC133039388 [Cannabis sativa]|uniref:uncharacterized protein LOC133039388 n=1 Tax=Cannabis sativa TaxID=3483 RepID=UPI0029CA835F|nr:uncharacterized protein LOC133039388 [Cannabis sativa]
MASEHKDCDGRIRCPCVRCINSRFEKIDRVRAHVFDRGFMEGYEKWIYHGEPEDVVDDVAVVDVELEDEMIHILEDFFPPTTEDVQGEDEQPTTNPHFDDLFEEIEAELYPGCDWISSLNFLAKLLHLKVRGKIPNNIFEELLKLLKFAFPKENNIPATYYEAKKRLKKLGLGYDSIHVYLYNCCLFYKENASKEACPVCGTSRWVTSENGKAKKVPCKVMRYFPLTHRLKRLYSSRITAKSMIWHHTGKSKDDVVLRHPVDGLAWKDFDVKHPEFARDPRNVRLGLAADGFNPFGNMSLPYSMWPVVLANYNLPPWLCIKDNYFLLSTLIPGAKSPGKDMDIFLRPLVDELKELWNNGVPTRDSSTNSMFTMCAALLWTVNDFPARSSLSRWSGQGYKACPTCNEDTTSIRVIGKTSYVGHRRFFPSNHAMRRDTRFDGKVERRPPPRRFTCEEILSQVNNLEPQILGHHENFGGVKRRRFAETCNWRKKSIFYELEYWSTNILKHNIDVMHVEKNVCDSLLGTILDNDKSKDTTNARHDLKKMGIRESLWIYEDGNGRLMKPQAPYVLTHESNIIGLKSHDCHVIMQRVLAVGVRKFLPRDTATTITQLSFFDIMIHLVLHLPKEAILGGPVFMRWMYPFERYMKKLKNYVGNKARPEGSIAEGYVADEAVTFCSIYFKGYMKKLKNYVGNKARPEGSIAEGYVADEAVTFCSIGIIKPLDHIGREKAEWYILQNSPEIQAYLDEHLAKIRHEYPNGNHDVLHRQTFRPWFHKKIYELQKLGTLQNGDELLALASGSDYLATFYEGCVVNGVRFIASKRDQKRKTQNSGVFLFFGPEGFNYYGTLEDVITISYTGAYTVTLFECKWYNTNPLRKKTITENNITSINTRGYWYQDEPYILANQDINDNEDETDVDVVSDSNSSNFVLTVDLGELIMQSNEPPVIVESSDQLVDSEIENNELDENYVAEEVDDLLVEHVEDENVNLVNDGNDSDSSV